MVYGHLDEIIIQQKELENSKKATKDKDHRVIEVSCIKGYYDLHPLSIHQRINGAAHEIGAMEDVCSVIYYQKY